MRGLSNLPPGVTNAMIEDAFGWDEPVLPRCAKCKAFLTMEPARREPWEDAIECDGSETFHDEPYTDAIIDIIGDEYRDKSYKVSTSPCGIEVGKHKPHRDILAAGWTEYRTCKRCGTETVESVM